MLFRIHQIHHLDFSDSFSVALHGASGSSTWVFRDQYGGISWGPLPAIPAVPDQDFIVPVPGTSMRVRLIHAPGAVKPKQ